MGNWNRYGLSKLANVLFTKALQRRFDAESIPILSIALHPGNIATDAVKRTGQNEEWLNRCISLEEGAMTPLFAAAHPKVHAERQKYAGAYLVPFGVVSETHENATRVQLQEDLWKISEEVCSPYLK
jgi:NAD(P)-dependent dehydrogenase (short-subunit alcohol dehydrogenase family)